MLGIIEDYKNLRSHLGVLIDKSGYKNAYIAEKAGIPAPNFSQKKKRGNWSVEEIEKVLTVIENQELEDIFLLEILKDRDKGDTITFEQFQKEMGWN
ncbi:hypothetical protein [Dyadobacter sp. CY326]|uniref:hypothetical protein n=1 Tax=Dyadobacter sp. CY326 TaxID=2907300 RepID=UPI001F1A40EB|nr:hypothetical protein [Dyadobacter sp. CY326]MCE7063990.1 hypothetical protein [Dyadobacter sp. CY326]